MKITDLLQLFRLSFHRAEGGEMIFFAPGRINLIGEHTDYNGGLVMPLAVHMGTYIVAAPNKENNFHLIATNFNESYKHPLGIDTQLGNQGWQKYPMGLIDWFVRRFGWPGNGWDILLYGDLPLSAGLSSSASVEMATAVMLNEIYHTSLPMIELVKAAKESENHFVGVSCGILDMFASGMGRESHCLVLDCNTLDFDPVPFNIQPYTLWILNTNVKRGLAGSKYNERVAECNEALSQLSGVLPKPSLCSYSPDEFEHFGKAISRDVCYKRAKHAIYENQRVKDAAEALVAADLMELGRLMYQSHDSLRDDYEVSCDELDFLVDFCRQSSVVAGARMTGAGFGGCAIALVNSETEKDFIPYLAKAYFDKFGFEASFYAARAGNGASRLL
ncbi:MAG: galactokinase [Bacteroidales bacterium]|jgi:galactokinase|nr:galactokinase [Bacteroidales bacterium]MDN5329782.1 galactokinase [Bacteroidales bacterium]